MFKTKIVLPLLSCLTASINLSAAITISSPDETLQVSIEVKEKLEPYPSGKRLYFALNRKGRPVLLDSPFRLDFKGMAPFARHLILSSPLRDTVDQTWTPVWGTQKTIANRYNQLQLKLAESDGALRQIGLVIRVFDDGFAFRYVIPVQSGLSDFKLASEQTEFHFPANPLVWAANYGSFSTHQETEFEKTRLNALKAGDVIGCPLLIQLPSAWVALTEANLTDWAGLYFSGADAASNAVVSRLSPRLDEPDVAVISTAPRESPWRVVMIGERPGDLIESNIILNLNPPSQIQDTSWIHPGLAAWDRWWSGSYAPDFTGKLGVDTESMKYFVDFAAEMGWEYQLVDWTWYGPPFDPDRPFGMAGNPKADLSKSIPELDLKQLVSYASDRGVKILLWLDWFNADAQMDRVFPLYEKWGIAGVKVDFMARDDQEMVNFYHRLVKLAARHHLVVDFHGAYKPTGFRRTFPNLITREGVLGNEYNKWSARVTPTHNVTLPFTRMLCGPMDFTPGGFRHKTVADFRVVGSDAPGPFVMGTRCHQLAMMVVYESPLQVMTDSPYNYRMSPGGLEFLKVVPTTWDDTRVLDGFPGEFIVVARRSGDAWFLGGMNGSEERAVEIPLEFLGQGSYRGAVYSDAEETGDYPERLREKRVLVRRDGFLKAIMASGGGYLAHLEKVE